MQHIYIYFFIIIALFKHARHSKRMIVQIIMFDLKSFNVCSCTGSDGSGASSLPKKMCLAIGLKWQAPK